MKHSLLFLFTLLSIFSFAQTNTGTLLLVSLEDTFINLDGDNIGLLKPESPKKLSLKAGEHYILAKKVGKLALFNKKITIKENEQNIVEIVFEPAKEEKTDEGQVQSVSVAELNTFIEGTAISDSYYSTIEYYAFEEGDEILLTARIQNKKGEGIIKVFTYPDDVTLYKNDGFRDVFDKKIKINKRTIVGFALSTNNILGKDCMLKIDRVPSAPSTANFNSTVKIKRDSSYVTVQNADLWVHSISNAKPNRTIAKINLPKNTRSWVYWIGVGQGSKERMSQFANTLSSGIKLFTTDPITAFAANLIPSLPVWSGDATINYRFLDTANAQSFRDHGNKVPYSYYRIKEGNNVSADYSKIDGPINDLYIGFWNMSRFNGHPIQVKVVALVVKESLDFAQ